MKRMIVLSTACLVLAGVAGCSGEPAAGDDADRYLGTGTHIASEAVVTPPPSEKPTSTPEDTPAASPSASVRASLSTEVRSAAAEDLRYVRDMRSDFAQGLSDATDLLAVKDVAGAVDALKSGASTAVSTYIVLSSRTCEDPRPSFPADYPLPCGSSAKFVSPAKCVDRFSRGMLGGNFALAKLGLLDCDKVIKSYDAVIKSLTSYLGSA